MIKIDDDVLFSLFLTTVWYALYSTTYGTTFVDGSVREARTCRARLVKEEERRFEINNNDKEEAYAIFTRR